MRPEKIDFPDEIPVQAFVRCVEQYPYHWHDALEIIQVLKGSVHIGLGDERLLLRENDIAVVNMGELHRISKGQEENEVLFVQIDDRFCRSILPDNRYLFIYCCSTYHEVKVPGKYQKLKGHIVRLVRAFNEKEKPLRENKKDIKHILKDMLTYLTYYFDFLRWGFGTVAFDEKRVERLRQIAEHTSTDHEVKVGLKELAETADITLQHLSHDIKDKFGLTFQELLYYSKCEHAAKLLLSTGVRIVDIALECRFSDPKYLIKHFRKYFHHTPSEFRKMHRTDDKTLAAQVQYRDVPLSRAIEYFKNQELE